VAIPTEIGLAQVRAFELSDNRITLRPPERIVDGKPVETVVVWERIS